MISAKVQKAINDQINAEIWSGYMYLSMSAYFETKGLKGFAKWMRLQWEEELGHALKFFDYVNERGGSVELKAIDKVPTMWSSPLEAMKETYNHEQKVTSLIYNIMELAIEEKDFATQSFLKWFVDEQVEEEANASDICTRLEMVADNINGILAIDKELGKRQK